jgi:hypothetical protein
VPDGPAAFGTTSSYTDTEELQRRGWDQSELQRRRKGDPEKLAIARRLRTETTMTLAWMADKLSMGAPGALANCLRNKLR